MAPILGYWSARGIGEPIRMLLWHVGVEYTEEFYDFGPAPEFDRSCWLNVKKANTMGLELPNLPYYIDGDTKITESSAILRHLARKHGLDGDTEEEKVVIDIRQSVLMDMITPIIKVVLFNPNFESDFKALVADIDTPLKKCEILVGCNDFVAGPKISYVDFMMLEHLERYDNIVPGCLEKYSKLKAYHSRMTSLPGVKKYRAGPVYQKIKTRFYGRFVKHGHGEESY